MDLCIFCVRQFFVKQFLVSSVMGDVVSGLRQKCSCILLSRAICLRVVRSSGELFHSIVSSYQGKDLLTGCGPLSFNKYVFFEYNTSMF